MSSNASSAQTPSFDIFLSHAGEDKETIARPLYERLGRRGISVFFDIESFRLGDHCPQVMEQAMKTAPVGVFIMSPEFVAKEWPMRELICFVNRFDGAAGAENTPPLLIPVFYRLETRDCRDEAIFEIYSSLFCKHGLIKRALDGRVPLQNVWQALDTAATVWSIENDLGASNRDRPNMASTRESFIDMIQNRILERLREERPDLLDKCHPVEVVQPQHQDEYRRCNMVPSNPPRLTLDFGSPTTCEGRLKAAVLGGSTCRIVAVIASGKGGVGKTCALRGLAEDVQIKQAFPGGILYIQLGNDAGKSDLVKGIAKIVDRSGGSNAKKEIQAAETVQEACETASKWFDSRVCLFLIDDIWKLNGIDSKVLSTLGLMVDESSRMVYTTRDEHFLRRANKVIEFKEREAFGDVSRRMLLTHAGISGDTVLDHKNEVALNYFLNLCQGLPLGFGIVGGSVWEYTRQCLNKQDALSEFYSEVSSNEKDWMDEEADDYGRLSRIVDVSLEVLEKRNVDVEYENRFRALCVLQKRQCVPVQMLRKLWGLDTLRRTKNVVESLANVSVVQIRRNDGWVFVELHDLMLDIAVRKAAEKIQGFFQQLVRNYISSNRMHEREDSLISTRRGADEEQRGHALESQLAIKRPVEAVVRVETEQGTGRLGFFHEWWRTEDDGYLHDNLCRLLRRAGYVEKLLWLLSQPQWIVKRLVEGGIFGVEQDLGHGKAMCDNDESRHADRKGHLKMIGIAARMSASFVNQNSREVWFQLHGRLLWHATRSELTSDFEKRMEMCAPKPWLKASMGFLLQAGCGALEVVNGPGRVLCTHVEGDEIWILWKSDDKLHVGNYNGTYSRHEQEELAMEEEMGDVEEASFLPDQRSVVTAHKDGTIRVWNRETGACQQEISHECEDHVHYLQFYADGARIGCEALDHSIRLWDTLSGILVGQPLRGHRDEVVCMAVSADGSRIVSGSCSGEARVWDAQSGNAVGEALQDRAEAEVCVAVSADGSRVVLGFADGTMRVRNARSGKAVGPRLAGHTKRVMCLAVSADGSCFVSGSEDRTVCVWDARSGNAVGEPLRGHTAPVMCVEVSADGSCIVSGSYDETVRVWDAKSGYTGREWLGGDGVVGVAVSSDGNCIVSGSWDGTVRVWDARSGNAVGPPLRGHTDSAWCVAVNADGSRVVSGSVDGTVRVWDAQSSNAVGQPLRGHTAPVMCVAESADGSCIASGSEDRTVRVWDSRSGNAVGPPLRGHTETVFCVAVSANGSRVVSGSVDGTVRVWDAQGSNAVGEPLRGHTAPVMCVTVSADGNRIVSGSFDKTVRVWDARSSNAVGPPLRGHTDWVRRVGVSADGTRVVSDDGGMERLWVLNAGGGECVLTSHDAAWERTVHSLALTRSSRGRWDWEPRMMHVGADDGSQAVLGTFEGAVKNIDGGDVYFDAMFASCHIVR